MKSLDRHLKQIVLDFSIVIKLGLNYSPLFISLNNMQKRHLTYKSTGNATLLKLSL